MGRWRNSGGMNTEIVNRIIMQIPGKMGLT